MSTGRTVHVTAADGTVLDWLVSPAWTEPATDLADHVVPDGDPFTVDPGESRLPRWVLTNAPDASPLKERLALAHPLPSAPPKGRLAEREEISWQAGGQDLRGTWSRARTGTDGFVDWSDFAFTPQYRWAVAGTQLEVDQAEWRTLEVSSTGPFVLWVAGQEVLRGTTFSYMEPERSTVRLRLGSGTTPVHLATWQVAMRECRHIARLRVDGLPVQIVIPGTGADEHAGRIAERVLAEVGSVSWALADGTVDLRAPAGAALRLRAIRGDRAGPWGTVRVPPDGRLRYAIETSTGAVDTAASILGAGEAVVEVGVDDQRCPQVRRLRVATLPPDYRAHPHGTREDWRSEVLRHLAERPGPAGLLARHTSGTPGLRVRRTDLAASLERVRSQGDCADFELIALLMLWHKVPHDDWDDDARSETAATITGSRYWIDQPGLDAMCFFTENHQLVWHVAETLAGESFPEATFAVDGRPGTEHAEHGRTHCAQWLDRKLRSGFSEFESNAYVAIDTLALTALIECGSDPDLSTAATTLLDRLLICLAANSWQGIHGSAHGRSYVRTQRSARFEETSPILRLIAGVGTLNDALLPTAVLASAARYQAPDVVAPLATETGDDWWGRQVSSGTLVEMADLLSRPYRSDVRVWRTPHVMLSSVQDYRSGLPGLQEHVWGATLGPEAQVYLTHPANTDTSGSARPNAWMGHRVLPRVHQHRDVVLGAQRFTPTDPTQATHLWFPVAHLEEWTRAGEWLLGRIDRGYVAVATPGGFHPVRSGDQAWQEWTPAESGSAWACLVGDADRDGTFEEFVASVVATEVAWSRSDESPAVTVSRPGRPTLAVTFDGVFTVDGVVEGLDETGRPAPDPQLQNPAVVAELGAETLHVAWAGVEHTVRADAAQRALRSRH